MQRQSLSSVETLTTERSRLSLFLLLSLLLHGALYLSQHIYLRGDESVGNPKASVEVSLIGPNGPSQTTPEKTPTPSPQKPAEKKVNTPIKPAPAKQAAPKARPEVIREPTRTEVEKPQLKPKTPSADPSPSSKEASNKAPDSTTGGAPSSNTSASSSQAAPSQAGGYEGPKVAAYLHNPRPEYPPMAKRREWEGRVILKVRVLASGSAGEVSVATSSGHDILDESALEAVKHWRFIPAKRGGQPVDSWVNVPLNFSLLDAK